MVKYRAIYALLPFCATALFASAFVAGTPQADGAPAHTAESGQPTATIVKTIDAKKNKVGDPVTLKSTVETTLGNGIIIPAGSLLEGHIDSIGPSENQGDSTLVVTFDKLAIQNGKEVPIKATVASVMSFSTPPRPDTDYNAPDNGRMVLSQLGTGGSIVDSTNPKNRGSSPHSVPGLKLSGSAKDLTSAALTQAKKTIHLTSDIQMVVSIAAISPP